MDSSTSNNISTADIQNYQDAFLIIHFVQASLITILNLAIIVIYRLMHYNRKIVSNYLLFSQGLSDLYIGFIMWFEIIVHYLRQHGYNSCNLSMIYEGLLEYSYTLSLGNLFLCAIERYLSVNKPIFHRRNVTKVRVIFGSILVCIISFIPPISLLLLMTFISCNSKSIAVINYSFAFDAVMIILITSSVAIILITLRNARKVIQPKFKGLMPITRESVTLRQNLIEAKQRKEFRLVKIFFTMITAYIATYLPVTIGRILYDVGALNNLNPLQGMTLIFLCHTLYKTSAIFNPVLTVTLREDYRLIFTKWIKKGKNNKERKYSNIYSMTNSNRDYIYTTYV